MMFMDHGKKKSSREFLSRSCLQICSFLRVFALCLVHLVRVLMDAALRSWHSASQYRRG